MKKGIRQKGRFVASASIVIALLCYVLQITALTSEDAEFAVGISQQTFVRRSATWGSRTLAATIWYPAAGKAGPPSQRAITDAPPRQGRFPLVVYSHGGCGGSAKAIEPVALSIASSGFVFLQFPHPGSTADDCVSGGERYTQALLERPDDIVHVVNELERLNDDILWHLHDIVETSRIGIIGHSQGGQTALMMPARDPRVRAVLSLSPSVAHPDSPPALWQAISSARVPVMIVHGKLDTQWTSEGPLKAYDSIPSDTPRAYLELNGMGHTPSTPDDVALIIRYARALFQLYLRGDEAASELLDPSSAPPNVSFKSSHLP
jgi:predicted dienelactone hydrolase